MTPKNARLTFWEGPLPEVGDYLRTHKGTTYVIIGSRPNFRKEAKSLMSLNLLRLDGEDEKATIPPDATIHRFKWNGSPRSRKGV